MVADRHKRGMAWAALLTAALTLAGCATSVGEMPVAGAGADTPAPPKEPDAYLPVHDLPPDRDEPVIDVKERAKIEAELIRARDHQASVQATKDAAKDKGAAKGKTAAKRKPVETHAED